MSTLVTTALRHNASASNNMVLDSNGRVGIGTATPANQLHVVGNNAARLDSVFAFDIRPGTSDFSSIAWKSTNGVTTHANIGPDVAGSGSLWLNGATNMFLATGGAERMRIDSVGNIGIGTSNPIRRLTVAQNGTPEFVLQDTSQGTDLKNWRVYNAGQTLLIGTLNDAGTAGTDVMTFSRNGRISKPLQPGFYATSTIGNSTLANGGNLPFDSAPFNTGNHFNTTTFRFTAPVSGYYLIAYHLFVQTATNRVSIKVNNASYQFNQTNVNPGTNSWAGVMYLLANDFVTVGDWQNLGGATFFMGHGSFSGFLLG